MADSSSAGPAIVTVFRSRLREDAGQQYRDESERMLLRARQMPGFVDIKTFTADDGERVSVVTFDSMESHRRWRDDPEHRQAQHNGRRRYYSEYHIQVCELVSERRFGAA